MQRHGVAKTISLAPWESEVNEWDGIPDHETHLGEGALLRRDVARELFSLLPLDRLGLTARRIFERKCRVTGK